MKISSHYRLSLKQQWCLVLILLTAGLSGCAAAHTSAAKTYVYHCAGEESAIVVRIEGDRGHFFSRQASQAIQQEAGGKTYVGEDVRYLPDRAADLAPGQTAEITINGKQLANCKNDSRAAVWEAARLNGVSYRAIGQEPAWVLEIDRDKGFLLVTDYGQSRQRFPYREGVSDAAGRTGRYTSELNGERIEITVMGETCRDSMSGEVFSGKVEVDWRGQTLRGCGRALH